MDYLTETLKRLEWLSSSSRSTLLARHALRVMGEAVRPSDRQDKPKPNDALKLFRVLIAAMALDREAGSTVVAPMKPELAPTDAALGFRNNDKVFAISISDGLHYSILGRSTSYAGELQEHFSGFSELAHETRMVYQELKLTDRSLAVAASERQKMRPLWDNSEAESRLTTDAITLLERMEQQTKSFVFWREWYQGFLDGKPLDWKLQKEIALIPDAEWEKGPEHIAGVIDEIRARFLARRLPQAETIRFNEESARFYAEAKSVEKPDLLGATLAQMADALDDVLADPSNGLHEKSHEVRVLHRTFAKYGNDPQRIEMDLTSVHASLTRQIATEELPASEVTLALIEAAREGAQGIRATDAEVADNRRLLTEQALAELTDPQLALLEEAQPVLEAISEGQMAEDWRVDIPYLLSEELRLPGPPRLGGAERNPVLGGYDEKARLFSRAAKIMILIRNTPKIIHRIDGSAGYKAARIVTTLGALVGLGIALISVL